MKKVKIILASLAIVGVVSAAFAFTSVKSTTYYQLDDNGNCRQEFLGTIDNVSPIKAYNTTPSDGACPLSARIKTPQ